MIRSEILSELTLVIFFFVGLFMSIMNSKQKRLHQKRIDHFEDPESWQNPQPGSDPVSAEKQKVPSQIAQLIGEYGQSVGAANVSNSVNIKIKNPSTYSER